MRTQNAAKWSAFRLLSTTAIALALGLTAAAAQSGGDVRKNDRKIEKALDNRELTPIRPIRRVGPDSWPQAQPSEQQSADQKKNETTQLSTTGQASKDDKPNTNQASDQKTQPANNQAAAPNANQGNNQAASPPAGQANSQPASPPAGQASSQPANDQNKTKA